MGFIVTRTLPATYVYGIYRHAHSARHVRIWDLSSRALCPPRTYMGFIVTRTLPATYVYGIYRHAPSYWNDSMRFRIIVYTPVTMATGSIICFCTALPVRLVGGAKSTSFHSGRVEVFINGQWGTVCDDSWSSNDAWVVCRQLRYTSGIAYGGAIYGEGTGPIWLDYVRCRGYESSLLNCPHRGTGQHNCGHGEDASVACYNGRYIDIQTMLFCIST